MPAACASHRTLASSSRSVGRLRLQPNPSGDAPKPPLHRLALRERPGAEVWLRLFLDSSVQVLPAGARKHSLGKGGFSGRAGNLSRHLPVIRRRALPPRAPPCPLFSEGLAVPGTLEAGRSPASPSPPGSLSLSAPLPALPESWAPGVTSWTTSLRAPLPAVSCAAAQASVPADDHCFPHPAPAGGPASAQAIPAGLHRRPFRAPRAPQGPSPALRPAPRPPSQGACPTGTDPPSPRRSAPARQPREGEGPAHAGTTRLGRPAVRSGTGRGGGAGRAPVPSGGGRCSPSVLPGVGDSGAGPAGGETEGRGARPPGDVTPPRTDERLGSSRPAPAESPATVSSRRAESGAEGGGPGAPTPAPAVRGEAGRAARGRGACCSGAGGTSVPGKEYPDLNFVGRVLGPGGPRAQQLGAETGGQRRVPGPGAVRDAEEEEQSRGAPAREPLREGSRGPTAVGGARSRAETPLEGPFCLSFLLRRDMGAAPVFLLVICGASEVCWSSRHPPPFPWSPSVESPGRLELCRTSEFRRYFY
ncbi:uncharacterized protein [Manis javanica]|uniref:uncharacterized protein n=1 Tax=Manis javanica TaxID=9974 RepID=UPI003C6DA35D